MPSTMPSAEPGDDLLVVRTALATKVLLTTTLGPLIPIGLLVALMDSPNGLSWLSFPGYVGVLVVVVRVFGMKTIVRRDTVAMDGLVFLREFPLDSIGGVGVVRRENVLVVTTRRFRRFTFSFGILSRSRHFTLLGDAILEGLQEAFSGTHVIVFDTGSGPLDVLPKSHADAPVFRSIRPPSAGEAVILAAGIGLFVLAALT